LEKLGLQTASRSSQCWGALYAGRTVVTIHDFRPGG
jgi:hypothetical protein